MDSDRNYLRGLAVPFNVPTRIGERVNGHLRVYRETFDADSFANLPERVPLTRRHDVDAPIGWAKLRITERGLEAEGELLETETARDLVTAIRAGLLDGLSIGFLANDSADVWQRGTGTGDDQTPSVLRRGVRLDHLATVAIPAYEAARVGSIGRRSWQQEEDAELIREAEAMVAPLRAEQAARRQAQATADGELIQAMTRMCAAHPAAAPVVEPVTLTEALAPATLDDDALDVLMAADGRDADRYRAAVVAQIRRAGRALTRTELADVARRKGIRP